MMHMILYVIIYLIVHLNVTDKAVNSAHTGDPLDIDVARLNEARRRLRLLGELTEKDYDYQAFRKRSSQTLIPMPMLKAWHEANRRLGLGGLQPDWEPLSLLVYDLVLKRRADLGDIADAESVTDEDIAELAKNLGWREPRARVWLLRYRRGGLWGLAPTTQLPKRNEEPPQMPGSLEDKDLWEIERRTLRLGWLLEQTKITDKDVQKRASEIGCAPRTLWRDLGRHRQYGPYGLARDQRSDKGGRHADNWYSDIIIACRLTKKDATVNWVYDEVCRRARRRGMPEPSFWRVRSTCEEINEYIKARADGREDDYRNKFRFAGILKIEGVVYEIDHTQVDVLVKDLRSPKYRTKSGAVRPWITNVIEANSRLVVATVFGYDKPDRFTVAEAIRRALVISDTHPYGGIPADIWIDLGEELKSRHVTTICWSLHIRLHLTFCPEHKPHVERFFRTLNTRLWSEQPGYVNSSVGERNPTAEKDVSHTIATLEQEYWKFINDKYHQEIHSELGVSPLVFWDENCFTEAPDTRQLDILLMEPETRRVTKGRISLDGRLYIHPDLATHVATNVLVRRPNHYGQPDFIEVYKNGEWVCTAVALDSEMADSISAEDVQDAQRAQRKAAAEAIAKAKETRAADDQQHAPMLGQEAPKPGELGPESPLTDEPDLPPSSQVPTQQNSNNTSKNNGSFLRSLGRLVKSRQEDNQE